MTYNNQPFTILTESWFIYDRIKWVILRLGAKILGRKIHWPVAVFDSLVRWLEDLKSQWQNIVYNINPSRDNIHETVVILMFTDTLKYSLKLKKQWIIKYIYAWPAISVPLNKSDIFFDQWVDRIVVPSQRVADYFISINSQIKDKLIIRPAWVLDPYKLDKNIFINKEKSITSSKLLIYKKNCPDDLYIHIINKLKEKNISYDEIFYGKFDHNVYMDKLDNCNAMIYLQESESQWIALQESWIRNIPTLVRNRWFWRYQTAYRQDDKISAPYMTNDCGIFFRDKEDFNNKLDFFLSNIYKYKAREYCLKNLTDKITSKLLLNNINK